MAKKPRRRPPNLRARAIAAYIVNRQIQLWEDHLTAQNCVEAMKEILPYTPRISAKKLQDVKVMIRRITDHALLRALTLLNNYLETPYVSTAERAKHMSAQKGKQCPLPTPTPP